MTTIDYGEHGLVTGQRYYYGRGLWGERGLVTGQRYYYGRGLWNDGCIIAWMPLKPEPYKAESEDKE